MTLKFLQDRLDSRRRVLHEIQGEIRAIETLLEDCKRQQEQERREAKVRREAAQKRVRDYLTSPDAHGLLDHAETSQERNHGNPIHG